ncbi:MAG: chemotaxis protein CheW, partial [Zestosphaera sp.]
EKLRGAVEISTERDKGTLFRISLPLTLSIVDALLVSVMDETLAVPLSSIARIVDAQTLPQSSIFGQAYVDTESEILPVISLASMFRSEGPAEGNGHYLLVVESRGGRMGLMVDQLLGRTEIVIKTLSKYVDAPGIGGATILGDGRVALIIDINSLVPILISKVEASRHEQGRRHK